VTSHRRSLGKGVPEWITAKTHHSDIFASSFFGGLSLKEVVSSIFLIVVFASFGVLPALRFV
jgi:hypothetical protein